MQRSISLLLAFILASAPLNAAFAQEEQSDFAKGQAAGIALGETYVSEIKILWGATFGPFAVIYNFVVLRDPPSAVFLQMEDRSEEYMRGYISGFREGFRMKSIKYNLIGWGAMLLVYIMDNWYVHY